MTHSDAIRANLEKHYQAALLAKTTQEKLTAVQQLFYGFARVEAEDRDRAVWDAHYRNQGR